MDAAGKKSKWHTTATIGAFVVGGFTIVVGGFTIVGATAAVFAVYLGYLQLSPEGRDELCGLVHHAFSVCAQPIITKTIPERVEPGQPTVIATVRPASPGEQLTVRKTNGVGEIKLTKDNRGRQQITYYAPADLHGRSEDFVSYVVATTHAAALGEATVPLNRGPVIEDATPEPVEQRQSIVIAKVTPGSGGSIRPVRPTGGLGTVRLGDVQAGGVRTIIYEAPARVSKSEIDTVTFSISDDYVEVPHTTRVQLDVGPTISRRASLPVERAQTRVIAVVAPSLGGGDLSLRRPLVVGGGSIELGPPLPNGTREVIYTAPSQVSASTYVSVSYSISDKVVEVEGTATVRLDAGPTIVKQPANPVEQTQTTIVATVVPGETEPVLNWSQSPGVGVGTIELHRLPNGPYQVLYRAPAQVIANTSDTVSFSVWDRNVEVHDTATVQLDVGPMIADQAVAPLEPGHSVVIATVTPGTGNPLSVSKTSGAGQVALGTSPLPNGSYQVIYTAPAEEDANAMDSDLDRVAYTITDQYVSVPGTANVPMFRGIKISDLRAQIGMLSCDIPKRLNYTGIGISKLRFNCTFSPQMGESEQYEGTLTSIGVKVGVTAKSVMKWAVVAPTLLRGGGALEGKYLGITVDTPMGGISFLLGGSNKTISLQPVAVQTPASVNVNIAASIGGIDLRALAKSEADDGHLDVGQ